MSKLPSIIKQDAFDKGTLTRAYQRCTKFDDELTSKRDTELNHLQAQFRKKGEQVKSQWGQVIDNVNNRIEEITKVLPSYFAQAIKTNQGRFVLSNSELSWQVNPIRDEMQYDSLIYSELNDSQVIGFLQKEVIVNRSITGPFDQMQPLFTKIIGQYNQAYQETINKIDDIKQFVKKLPTDHEIMFTYVLGTIETEEWFFKQNDQLWTQFVQLVSEYQKLINKEINYALNKSLPYLTIKEDQLLPSIVIEKASVVDPLLDKVLNKRNLLKTQEREFIKIIDQIKDTLNELWYLRPQLKLQIIQNVQGQQTSPNIVQIINRGNYSFLIQHGEKTYHVNVFDLPSTIKIPWFVIRRLIDRNPQDYQWFCTFVIASGYFNFTDVTLQSVEQLKDHFSQDLYKAQMCKELRRVLIYEVPTNMILIERNLNRTEDRHQQILRYRPEVYQTNHPFQTKHMVLRESDKSLILYQNWKGKEVIIPVNTQIEGIRTFECDDEVPFQKNNIKQFVHFLLYWEAQKNELSQTMIKDYEQWLTEKNQSSRSLRYIVIQKLVQIKLDVSQLQDICNYEIEVFSCQYEGQRLFKSIEDVHSQIMVRQQQRNMDNIQIKDTVCLAVCLISESQFAVITPTLPMTYVNVIPGSSQNQENVLRIDIQDEILQEILGNEKERPNLLAHIILTLQKLPIPQNHILTFTTDHLQQIQDELQGSYDRLIIQIQQRTQEQKEIENKMKQFQVLASAVGIEYQLIYDTPVGVSDLNRKVQSQWQQTKRFSLLKQISFFYNTRCGNHYVYKDTRFDNLLVIYASEDSPSSSSNQITRIHFAQPMILGIFQKLQQPNNGSLLKTLAWIIDVLFTENQALSTPITVDLALLNTLYDRLNHKYKTLRQKDYQIKRILEPIYQYFSVIRNDQKDEYFGKQTHYPFEFVLILSQDQIYQSQFTLVYSEDQHQNVHNYPIGTDRQLKASTQDFRIDKYMMDILQVDNIDLAIIFFYAMVLKQQIIDAETIETIIELLHQEHTKAQKIQESFSKFAKKFIDPDREFRMNQSQDMVIKLANFTLRNLKQNIVHMKTDAIVNAANRYLGRGNGVCGAIFKACGQELDKACDAILKNQNVTEFAIGSVVTTRSYSLLEVKYILHAVGPSWNININSGKLAESMKLDDSPVEQKAESENQEVHQSEQSDTAQRKQSDYLPTPEQYGALETFINRMFEEKYRSEDRLLYLCIRNVSLVETFIIQELFSVAIPAISSGIYGFPKPRCASIFFYTIDEFIQWVTTQEEFKNKDLEINLTNIDEETYEVFRKAFLEFRDRLNQDQ